MSNKPLYLRKQEEFERKQKAEKEEKFRKAKEERELRRILFDVPSNKDVAEITRQSEAEHQLNILEAKYQREQEWKTRNAELKSKVNSVQAKIDNTVPDAIKVPPSSAQPVPTKTPPTRGMPSYGNDNDYNRRASIKLSTKFGDISPRYKLASKPLSSYLDGPQPTPSGNISAQSPNVPKTNSSKGESPRTTRAVTNQKSLGQISGNLSALAQSSNLPLAQKSSDRLSRIEGIKSTDQFRHLELVKLDFATIEEAMAALKLEDARIKTERSKLEEDAALLRLEAERLRRESEALEIEKAKLMEEKLNLQK